MKSCIKQNKKEIFLFVWLIVLALLNAFLYDTMIVFAIVIFIGAILLKTDYVFYIMAFCIPLASIFKLSADSISVLPVLFAIFIIKLAIHKKIYLYEHNIVAFAFLCLLQAIGVLFYRANIISTLSFLLNVFFVMCASAYFMKHSEVNRQMKVSSIFFIAGSVFDVLIADIFPNITLAMNAQKMEALEYNNRYAALNMDPNEFSQYMLISICLCIALLPIIKSKAGKLLDIFVILFLASAGYRSYSKGYILTFLAVVVIVFIMYLIRLRKAKGPVTAVLFAMPVIVVGAVCSLVFYKYFVLDVFAVRDSFNTDLLSERGYIWTEYIKALGKRLDVFLLGCGQQNFDFLRKFTVIQSNKVPHNAYLDFIIQYGIVGTISYMICWKKLIKNILTTKKSTYLILAILAFMISSFSLSINANDSLFVLAVIVSMNYSDGVLKNPRKRIAR